MSRPELDLLQRAADLLVEKKGGRLVIVDLEGSTIPSSYFLIAEGESPLHVRSMADELQARLPVAPLHVEGLREGQWVLLDYGDFVVHLFEKEVRAFYDLEGLWPAERVRPWPLTGGRAPV